MKMNMPYSIVDLRIILISLMRPNPCFWFKIAAFSGGVQWKTPELQHVQSHNHWKWHN